ncbi:MAG: 4Fe-4S ferredoxin [Thermoprotei archaeon]|nr:MAG: 4Fe-4S ferredoxin [Thermoprotei archaeon]RLF19347.1 MAG: 4Fe-4S ferredoxin [Thermoprotei archaeon]
MKLMEVWVKAPLLRNADILIVSECLKYVNKDIFNTLCKGKVTLTVCPENENPELYGKLASIVRSSNPKSITVVTIEGSPHCFLVHAAINEAAYILGEKIPRKHYVVVNGRELVEITPEAVRVARYLSLVDKLIRKNRDILKELRKLSLEYKRAEKSGDAVLR